MKKKQYFISEKYLYIWRRSEASSTTGHYKTC